MDEPGNDAIAMRVLATPADTTLPGDIFGGWLMCQMDLAAGSIAARRSGGRVVTIAADSMTFLRPVKVDDGISVYATLDRNGRTSMRINVEAWPRYGAAAEKVTEAAFTFVAVDDDGLPRALPDVENAIEISRDRKIDG